MNNLKEQFKEEFGSLELSDNLLIKEQIRRQYNSFKKRKRIIFCILMFLAIGSVTLGTVYADEIKEFLNNFIIYETTENDYKLKEFYLSDKKVMNYDADLPELTYNGNGREYSLLEIEKILDMNILKSDYFKNDTVVQIATKKENEKIASAYFSILNFTNSNETIDEDSYSFSFKFKTKYSKSDNDAALVLGEQTDVVEYTIDSLKVVAYILSYSHKPLMNNYRDVAFVYDDVIYSLRFRFYNKTLEEELEIVKNILDSLHI